MCYFAKLRVFCCKSKLSVNSRPKVECTQVKWPQIRLWIESCVFKSLKVSGNLTGKEERSDRYFFFCFVLFYGVEKRWVFGSQIRGVRYIFSNHMFVMGLPDAWTFSPAHIACGLFPLCLVYVDEKPTLHNISPPVSFFHKLLHTVPVPPLPDLWGMRITKWRSM